MTGVATLRLKLPRGTRGQACGASGFALGAGTWDIGVAVTGGIAARVV